MAEASSAPAPELAEPAYQRKAEKAERERERWTDPELVGLIPALISLDFEKGEKQEIICVLTFQPYPEVSML